LTTAELVDTSAEIVIAIEKGGFLQEFVEEQSLIKNSNQLSLILEDKHHVLLELY
jgi:hypothetical protein